MDYDVIIAGAGPGGCIAARDFANAGFSVALFDTEEPETLGKPIVVEVEKQMFHTTGVPLPEGEEKPYHQKRMRVFSPRRKEAFTLEGEHPAVSLKLDTFAKRLLGYAQQAGAKFISGHKALRPTIRDGTIRGAVFSNDGAEVEVTASLTIDATGFAGALARELPPETGIGFQDLKRDVVLAENHWHAIDDAGARDAIKGGLHYDNEVWNRLGVYGNYSTEYSYLSLADSRAYILIGLKASADQPALPELIDRFRKEQGYFNDRLYGGSGPIRVRRAWDGLCAPGFLALGEAACMVIPAHGSGVASAMYAGKLAAEVGAKALKEGDPRMEALWPYSYKYQTGRGAVLATFDANKLMVESFDNQDIAALMESKAMHPQDLWNAAVPAPISMSARSLPTRLRGLVKNPALIRKVASLGRAISKVKKHYAAYPKTWDEQSFRDWSRETQRIFAPLTGGD